MAKEKGILTALTEALMMPMPPALRNGDAMGYNKARARKIISYLKKHEMMIVRTVKNDGPIR